MPSPVSVLDSSQHSSKATIIPNTVVLHSLWNTMCNDSSHLPESRQWQQDFTWHLPFKDSPPQTPGKRNCAAAHSASCDIISPTDPHLPTTASLSSVPIYNYRAKHTLMSCLHSCLLGSSQHNRVSNSPSFLPKTLWKSILWKLSTSIDFHPENSW
jgi:hypothetical protein